MGSLFVSFFAVLMANCFPEAAKRLSMESNLSWRFSFG